MNNGASMPDEALRKALIAKGIITQEDIDKQEPQRPVYPSID